MMTAFATSSVAMRKPVRPLGASIIMAVAFIVAGCGARFPEQKAHIATVDQEIANLHAFARLYGVVRWFHPSDAASGIDWDRFAISGARRVATASDRFALRELLSDIFASIAPTVHIVTSEEAFPNDSRLNPPSTGLDTVSWQHKGYGDSVVASGYASKRRNRPQAIAVPGTLFMALSQSFDATPYRGKFIRLRGKLRAARHGKARIWLRVDRGDASGFFDNMLRRPVASSTWADAEITGPVAPDATQVVVGVLMLGGGMTWYDDLELSVQLADGSWKNVDVRDGGFEELATLQHWRPGVSKGASPGSIDGWNVTVDHDRPASGVSSLRVEPATMTVTQELFDEAPTPNEAVDLDLGDGLRARVPIALYSQSGHTIGDNPDDARRIQDASPIAAAGFDVMAGVADVVVVWNVLEHFWPYWHLASVDWLTELDRALMDALDDRNLSDHIATLQRLSAAAPDGHASTSCPGEPELANPPFVLDFIEDHIVVAFSTDKAVERGDALVSIDGKLAMSLLGEKESRISGSSQWKRVLALQQLAQGPRGTNMALVLHRGNGDIGVTIARSDHPVSEQPSRPAIERLDDGAYYVDLSRTAMADLDAVMDQLAVAPGVVFDLRRRPNRNHQILSHLLNQPDKANKWMAIPLIIRPDSASSPVSWSTDGWDLPVLQPHIRGKVAFLTGPTAISYSESVMALVEYYRLGEIIGAPTAGSNGDIAAIEEPTGCQTTFTGRLVTKLDGSRHYLLGIQPTIPVSRTIAGVAAGRDEVLERGLAYIRGKPR